MAFVHEVETAFQKGQLGVETAYGTAVAATIALGSVTLTPSLKKTVNKFTPRGVLLPTVQTTGVESTEVGFDGIATYEDIAYFVKAIKSDAQVDPLTGQLIYTVEAGGLQIPGCIVTGWTLKGNRDEVTLSGTMLGKKGIIAAPTAALTPATQTPISAAGVAIKINSVTYTKIFEWELALSELWGGVTFVGSSQFANVLQKAITGTFKIKTENDSGTAPSAQALLELGSTVPVEIKATTGAKVLTIGFDAQVGEPGSFSDEEGVYAIEHNFNIMNKATTAVSVSIV
ncbi:MAG: hypothetical protein ABFD54_11450 [Armatimonadota bacterium]